MVKYDQTEDEYVEKFKYSLLSKKDKARFPLNDEFSLHFTEKDIFSMKNKNKIYILERLENFGTDEDKDVYKHCDEGTYSIEHIMPQSLTPHWMQHLGPNYKDIHNVWLHRIANLTLTAYNQKYSNRPFDEKKNMVDAVIVDANFNESETDIDDERDTSGLSFTRSHLL